jgi:hypothetical protein
MPRGNPFISRGEWLRNAQATVETRRGAWTAGLLFVAVFWLVCLMHLVRLILD